MKKLFLLPILFFVLGCQNNNNDDLIYQDVHVDGLAQIGETIASMEGADINDEIDTDAIAENLNDSLNDDIEAIQPAVSPIPDKDDSFLKIHDNTAWKMIEETFTEYTLFYNSDESFIKVYDFSCNDSLQSNKITDLDTALVVDLNSNTVTFQYFADGEYMVRTEGTYRDTLYRVESTADALWSELGCD
mgnify:FL=1